MTLLKLLPAFWGLVLLVSFIGYGALLRRLLFTADDCGWANQAAWGMACVVVAGGVFNLLNAISRPLLLILVTCGVVMTVLDLLVRRTSVTDRFSSFRAYMREHPIACALKLACHGAIIALAAIQYLASTDLIPVAEHSGTYNLMDNLEGYFIFPKQMLDAGGITPDPFNNLRLQNGLGGQSILHALVLALFDFKNIDIVDGGVALIIGLGLIWRIAKERGLVFPWQCLLALFFLCVPYYPELRINSSSFTTGMVMFLALFAFLDQDGIHDDKPAGNAALVGLLAACAFALKTNLVPPCVLIIFSRISGT